LYVMAPVMMQAGLSLQERFEGPASERQIEDLADIYESISTPLRGFLMKHTDERERAFFVRSATKLWPEEQARGLQEDHMLVLIPSFTLGELSDAFQIGFVLYLAFVVIDLIVGNVLLSLGMQMLSPTVISTPFKLLLFVAVDGWQRLIHGLVLSYQ